MKIGTNTLLILGGIAVGGYLYMQNKKKQAQASAPSDSDRGGGFGGGGGGIAPITPAVVVTTPATTTPPKEDKPTPKEIVSQKVTEEAPQDTSKVIAPKKNFVDTDTEEMSMGYLDFDGNMD